MIIIPERKQVIIVPPRSGSTSLKKWAKEQYEESFVPFRHGEYYMLTRLPALFEAVLLQEWEIVYVLRSPMQRMQSLWRYMQEVSEERNPRAPQDWRDRCNSDADRPFNEWLINSTLLFNEPSSPAAGARDMYYDTHFSVPAARKSAAYFLRGCRKFTVLPFNNNAAYGRVLGMPLLHMAHENATDKAGKPSNITWGCHDFINNYHATDIVLEGVSR